MLGTCHIEYVLLLPPISKKRPATPQALEILSGQCYQCIPHSSKPPGINHEGPRMSGEHGIRQQTYVICHDIKCENRSTMADPLVIPSGQWVQWIAPCWKHLGASLLNLPMTPHAGIRGSMPKNAKNAYSQTYLLT